LETTSWEALAIDLWQKRQRDGSSLGAMLELKYREGMSIEPMPEGIPVTRAEWERLSGKARRWVMELFVETNELRCRQQRESEQTRDREEREARSSTRHREVEDT